MVRWFKGACEAVRAMHTYQAPVKRAANAQASSSRQNPPKMPQHSDDEDDDDDEEDDGPNPRAERGAHVPLVAF